MGCAQTKKKVAKHSTPKGLCRKVWTSYGIAVSLFSYFSPLEIYKFHEWNKFYYDIAIARV